MMGTWRYRRTRAVLPGLLTVLIALAALLPGVALAVGAGATLVPANEVELWPGGGANGLTSLIAVARVPDSVKLPTQVRISLPAGATITWAGQILGTNTSSDIEARPVTGAGAGGQYVELTASKSRVVQYEAVLPAPKVRPTGVFSDTLVWPQTTPASQVSFAVRLPVTTTDVTILPAPAEAPQRNDQLGQVLYPLNPVSPKVGSTFTLSVTYGLGGSAANQAGANQGSATTTPSGAPSWLFPVVIIAIALVPVVVLVMRRRRPATQDDGDDDEREEGGDANEDESDEGDDGEGDREDDSDRGYDDETDSAEQAPAADREDDRGAGEHDAPPDVENPPADEAGSGAGR